MFFKLTAFLLTITLLETFVLRDAQLLASPSFNDYRSVSETDMQGYMDRASRLNDADSWNNYVTLGLATERTEWENEAFGDLSNEFTVIAGMTLTDEEKQTLRDQAQAGYESALLRWESDADEHMLQERGEFLASKEAIATLEITDADYHTIIAEAQAQLADATELSVDIWDTTVSALHDPLIQAFEDFLNTQVDSVLASGVSLAGAERTAFEEAIAAREEELRSEFLLRDSFFLLSARNDYLATLRTDDMSTKLLSDQQSASALTGSVIDQALSEINTTTAAGIAEAQSQLNAMLSDPTADPGGASTEWQLNMEKVMEAGLRRWSRAEEELYSQRLTWSNERNLSREEAERI